MSPDNGKELKSKYHVGTRNQGEHGMTGVVTG